jgi:hypothetical protein
VAASVPGLIGAGGLPGWADTEPGIEDQALGHRDSVLPLDESGDGSGKVPLKDKAKTLAFMIARNHPRRLSKRHERANAQDREWRIIAQASSEAALQQARRRLKADGFRINGDIYLKPDRLRRWVPSHRDRVVLRDSRSFRTRRDDAATIEQVIAGAPGKPRYYVLDGGKLERLLRKKPSRT